MSKRYKVKRRVRRNHTCRECGSVSDVVTAYWLPDSDFRTDPPDDILCPTCAKTWYCLSCGAFCAGTEGFDFLHPGRCDNCQSAIEAEEDCISDGECSDYCECL